jgi:hypothetical protein
VGSSVGSKGQGVLFAAVVRAKDAVMLRLLCVRHILEDAALCCCGRDFGRHNKQCRGSSIHVHQPPRTFVHSNLDESDVSGDVM